MTARKNKSEQDNAAKDETTKDKAPGDLQTTDEAREKQENLSETPEKVEDAKADPTVKDEDDDEGLEGVGDEKVEGAVGAVRERDFEGNEYDAPYVLLTADHLPRTSDSDDPAKDWTAQHAGGEREDEEGNTVDPVALVPVEGTPGQTFRVRELPDRAVAEAAGVDYDQWVAGLPVRADVPNEAPRRGTPA